jgi:hypothetical protein
MGSMISSRAARDTRSRRQRPDRATDAARHARPRTQFVFFSPTCLALDLNNR